MAWLDNETLVLLPQYPEKFGDQGAIFSIEKSQILEYLQGDSKTAIQPSTIPFNSAGLPTSISGYEGFESIAISENNVYLTIESRPGGMLSYLVSGQITSPPVRIDLDPSRLTPISPQTSLKNFSDEALIAFGSRLVSIYEVNGTALNPNPVAHLFDLTLQLQDTLAFPSLEYRITDATPVDDLGRFWAINYFYPGDDELAPEIDPLHAQFGEGSSHAHSDAVERLIELQFSESGIVLSESPPIQLELLPGNDPRNWEAISRLDEMGFLLASDGYPTTILGFVHYP